jgi:hypothetical protein
MTATAPSSAGREGPLSTRTSEGATGSLPASGWPRSTVPRPSSVGHHPRRRGHRRGDDPAPARTCQPADDRCPAVVAARGVRSHGQLSPVLGLDTVEALASVGSPGCRSGPTSSAARSAWLRRASTWDTRPATLRCRCRRSNADDPHDAAPGSPPQDTRSDRIVTSQIWTGAHTMPP